MLAPGFTVQDHPRWRSGREPWAAYPAPKFGNYLLDQFARLADWDRLWDERRGRRDNDNWPTRDGAAAEEDG